MKQQKQFEFEWKKKKHSQETIDSVKKLTSEYDKKIEDLIFEKDIAVDNATAALTEELEELLKKVGQVQEQRRTAAQLALNRIDRQIAELKEEKYTSLLALIK